jgi:hypothetical protein
VTDSPPPLPEPSEVVEHRASPARMLLTLLGAAVGVTALVLGAGWAIGAISHTEQGFCGDPVPCTSLSLDRVRALSLVDLPQGTEVVDVYYRRGLKSAEFRSTVRLPAGSGDPLAGSGYDAYPDVPVSGRKGWAASLHDVGYAASIEDGTPHLAIHGIDREGRREIYFQSMAAL